MPTDKHKKAAISITKLAAQVVTCFDSLKLLNFPQNKSYIEMYSTVFLSRTIEWSQDNKKKEREKQQTTQICWTLLSLTNKLYQSFDILYIMTTFSFFFENYHCWTIWSSELSSPKAQEGREQSAKVTRISHNLANHSNKVFIKDGKTKTKWNERTYIGEPP